MLRFVIQTLKLYRGLAETIKMMQDEKAIVSIFHGLFLVGIMP